MTGQGHTSSGHSGFSNQKTIQTDLDESLANQKKILAK
jgi:hypothetical protein